MLRCIRSYTPTSIPSGKANAVRKRISPRRLREYSHTEHNGKRAEKSGYFKVSLIHLTSLAYVSKKAPRIDERFLLSWLMITKYASTHIIDEEAMLAIDICLRSWYSTVKSGRLQSRYTLKALKFSLSWNFMLRAFKLSIASSLLLKAAFLFWFIKEVCKIK